MAIIDRKFEITARSIKSGNEYTERSAIVFLLKDALLPDLLDAYHALCVEKKVGAEQIQGVLLLKDRVLAWQRKYPHKVKLPDVEPGEEAKRVCRPNHK